MDFERIEIIGRSASMRPAPVRLEPGLHAAQKRRLKQPGDRAGHAGADLAPVDRDTGMTSIVVPVRKTSGQD